MLAHDYKNFQNLILSIDDYEPSFSFFKNQKIDYTDVDSEIVESIRKINSCEYLCSDSSHGSCFGYHGGMDDFPHLCLWYDKESESAKYSIRKLFHKSTLIDIVSEFSYDVVNADSFYERIVSSADIENIQHVQISASDEFFYLEMKDRKKFCDFFWFEYIPKIF